MTVLLGFFEFVSCVLAMLNLGDAADSVVTAAASLDIAVSIIVMLLQLVLRFNKKRGKSAAELGGAKWKQGTMDHERHGGRRVRIQHACQNDRARATTHRNTMFALKEVQEAKQAFQLESLIILICGPRRKIS
ncbi:GPI-anchored surface protein, putative [Bodo saltans]|uniref:GPI-anchored surface protein, putative n=1 Tax=Bodo saltans TaxID=75058 RepID=A0A0S4J3D0_BODSA|nr:GPI-anchored surface protein, putative [Bodo saltans]|eukprot:CUG69605.1 GPI-anchored surface protein, putative [Bodo saltans]